MALAWININKYLAQNHLDRFWIIDYIYDPEGDE